MLPSFPLPCPFPFIRTYNSDRSVEGKNISNDLPPKKNLKFSHRKDGQLLIATMEYGGKNRKLYLYGDKRTTPPSPSGDEKATPTHETPAHSSLFLRPAMVKEKRAQDKILTSSSLPFWSAPLHPLMEWILTHFLPQGYPRSVTPHYLPYVRWQIAQGVLSAAGGVLATQSLLFAVGLSAGTAIPTAAAMNWVLKDGLGQAGGVIFASMVSNRFDADPKFWRQRAAYAMYVATIGEIITPLIPHLFLPMASIANIGKNISWIAASATKANIHRTLIKQENMADVTAKSASQTIASSLIGMALGIGLSFLIGPDTAVVLPTFLGLGLLHLYCNYRSLLHVAMPTFNTQRFEKVALEYIRSGTILTPDEVSKTEIFSTHYVSPFDKTSKLEMGAPLQVMATRVSDIEELAHLFYAEPYFIKIEIPKSFFSNHSLSWLSKSAPRVKLLFHEEATAQSLLRGFLQVAYIRHKLRTYRDASSASASSTLDPAIEVAEEESKKILKDSLNYIRLCGEDFVSRATANGWNCDHVFLEQDHCRVKLHLSHVQ